MKPRPLAVPTALRRGDEVAENYPSELSDALAVRNYRWRQRHDPARAPDDRRRRELEAEVERLKLLVAELMLDKQMLQDIAKKN